MPIPLAQLANEILPQRTVLFFGAGSSVPSKAPSVGTLIKHFSTRFGFDADGFSLSEISGLAEGRSKSRKRLITELRSLFVGLRPTGGLMNLGLYDWKSIFTTNYDDLVEQAYRERNRDLRVVSCDFDFTIHDNPTATKLFKIHGTIDKDVSDGHVSRIILTENDYEHTKDYRESLYTRLASDLAGSHLIIIGHSLADQDIKEVVAKASSMNARTMGSGRITLFLYQHDEDRAFLLEQRGLEVCFGGIDDFFAEIAKRIPAQPQDEKEITKTIDHAPKLRPITVDVADVADARNADVSAMFNGRPATYADIAGGLTFQRSLITDIEDFLRTDEARCAIILGSSGVGKTTIARQIVHRASLQGKACWEHVNEHPLLADDWLNIARRLEDSETDGLLLIDEASAHLAAIGEIIDRLTARKLRRLKLIVVSSRGRWAPRVKSPSIYRFGREWTIQQLRPEEIDRLLTLIDVTPQISVLVEDTFSGFSKRERRRRLVERCERDFFVCLKNIFASDNIDDIILREFAVIPENAREVYKLVAAMENAGIRVHRQLVIRLLQISANNLAALLSDMTDVVSEYVVDAREGIYAWKCRHLVIAAIVTKYKYSDIGLTVELLERVIENISPSFEIEIRTIRELCNVDTGLPRIPDKSVQNRLLRKMISVAPAERVPRHRLIRNLIAMNAFDKAETEIRIFTKDFGGDGPVQRYKINLMVGRATRTPGLMEEDRIVILEKARETAVAAAERYATNKNVLSAYAELGIEYFRRTKSYEYFDDAIARLKDAEESAGDPEFSKVIQRLERRIAGHASIVDEEEMSIDVD